MSDGHSQHHIPLLGSMAGGGMFDECKTHKYNNILN